MNSVAQAVRTKIFHLVFHLAEEQISPQVWREAHEILYGRTSLFRVDLDLLKTILKDKVSNEIKMLNQ
jgi:hypothetical protein